MTILRKVFGARSYRVLLTILLFATLIYQKETGVSLPTGETPVRTDPGEEGAIPSVILARVTRVIDGDTFEIESGEHVRLIGVDAPESVKPGTPVECFGKASSGYLRMLIEGKEVRLERDRTDRDRYDRLLRYAYLGDMLINENIVREGYAESVAYKPDTAKQEIFDHAEALAKAEQRGRWAEGACGRI